MLDETCPVGDAPANCESAAVSGHMCQLACVMPRCPSVRFQGEWHKYIFKRYCSVKKMDAALFRILLRFGCRKPFVAVPDWEATKHRP